MGEKHILTVIFNCLSELDFLSNTFNRSYDMSSSKGGFEPQPLWMMCHMFLRTEVTNQKYSPSSRPKTWRQLMSQTGSDILSYGDDIQDAEEAVDTVAGVDLLDDAILAILETWDNGGVCYAHTHISTHTHTQAHTSKPTDKT